MTPAYHDEWLTIYGGDVRDVLPELAADSVDCIVTSPPYWGLRDYGNHGQLGLERTPEEYVANMVAVFRELRRVLKPSGTCWLNLGDSYAANYGRGNPELNGDSDATHRSGPDKRGAVRKMGLKPKDLVGIPWRVAFALQADGWYLRSDIIWSKPNPMPESVTDRPTKSHEYLFLLTKSSRYFFDADAVRESISTSTFERHDRRHEKPVANAYSDGRVGGQAPHKGTINVNGRDRDLTGRNIRSVWTIATRPYPGAHFAVFPPELPERCIKAGSSERGVCPECGAPWERVVERTANTLSVSERKGRQSHNGSPPQQSGWFWKPAETIDKGWRRTCGSHGNGSHSGDHGALGSGRPDERGGDSRDSRGALPAVVLDPFAGSGTTGMVANRLSRRAILIDLNPEYLRQQLTRNAQTPLGLTEGDAA